MPRVFFIGDIVGRPGRTVVREVLPGFRQAEKVDVVVANAENAAGGSGLTGRLARELRGWGVDAITLGDHVWDQKSFAAEIPGLDWVCRPANLHPDCPGRDHLVIEKDGFRLGVFTVLGRNFLPPRDCPFQVARAKLDRLAEECDAILMEVHAEATSEKVALGWFADGQAALVVGTHTHIPTADCTLLEKGTGYCTDAGMTGPYRSVIGREAEPIIERFIDGMPRRFEVAQKDVRLSGVLVDIETSTGQATDLRLVHLRENEWQQYRNDDRSGNNGS
ncbi:MAG: YmdB family metallophosphoesterase [Opitutales bacterium]|nr:YmdB family metallophosphoesterase [Opitutales bacterium]MCH8541175.1 YmdB family metallophosphoesterase [Opitutales bacterium]